MPSSNPASDKKRKSTKASSKHSDDEPVKSTKKSSHKLQDQPKHKSTKKSKKPKEPVSDIDSDDDDNIEENTTTTQKITRQTTRDSDSEGSRTQENSEDDSDNDSGADSDAHSDSEDSSEEDERDIKDIANDATEQLQGNIEKIVTGDDSDDNAQSDADALTTMNAIMEYNKTLIQKLEALEARSGGLKKGDIQNSVHDTMHEVYTKYNKKEESTGTHQSHVFELPVGDMMKGYGAFSTSITDDKKDKDEKKHTDDEASTVKDDDDNIRIGDGVKDDIVVKVEATKGGITFSIHIPRN
ncbi:hypothetical protein INT47_006083 [Mucor saturninus]|uniref:Uncharacterized protein n=1 Tax=Mucor saturninus TaxID=64648 RepID=A0A8H7REI0_9FUNG|nr:hypothetical protein INT47_006083 [Mucor saturninus]